MSLNKIDSIFPKFYREIKEEVNTLFLSDVDICIRDIAFMKFWGLTNLFGGRWFIFTAKDFLNITSNKTLKIAIVSSWICLGVLLIVAGHDVYKIAKNRGMEKNDINIRKMLESGYHREITQAVLTSEISEAEIDKKYKNYKRESLKGTWFPIPSIWLKFFPIRNQPLT